MIFVNGVCITNKIQQNDNYIQIKNFLSKEKMVLINDDEQPMSEETLLEILKSDKDHYFRAVTTSSILRGFKDELSIYISKVENYIENEREIESNPNVINGFIDITESLFQFLSVEDYLQKKIIDQDHIKNLVKQTLYRVEVGDNNYVLDIIEYELFPILQRFEKEIIEEM